jgi:hypothetical protein
MTPAFKPGQRVQISRTFRDRHRPVSYEVVRPLPQSEDGEFRYRLKSEDEPHERVVRESEIELV